MMPPIATDALQKTASFDVLIQRGPTDAVELTDSGDRHGLILGQFGHLLDLLLGEFRLASSCTRCRQRPLWCAPG